MNKLHTAFVFACVLLCFAAAAQAELVSVSSQFSSATSSGPLGAGVEYLFTVSGFYSYSYGGSLPMPSSATMTGHGTSTRSRSRTPTRLI